jgi:hypothetical protein
VCSSVGRPARTSSIATGTKEEQQIRVETEFGLERGKTRVEGERIRVGEVLIVLNRSWHPVYIGWGGLILIGLVNSIFKSLN